MAIISPVERRSCAISSEACQATLSVLPAPVRASSGVVSGGTAMTGIGAWALAAGTIRADTRRKADASFMMSVSRFP